MSTVPQIISTEFIALYSEIQKLEEQLAKSQQIQSNLKNNISVISKKYHKAVSLIKSKTKNIDFAKEKANFAKKKKLILQKKKLILQKKKLILQKKKLSLKMLIKLLRKKLSLRN